MTAGIFLIDDRGELTEMRETPFQLEDHFQELLARYPNLLAGDQIDPQQPRRWLLVGHEVGIAGSEGGGVRWSVDHLFLDQEGMPTLVEVKRASDPRLRREVVGQMLDYAANAAVRWKVATARALFEERCRKAGADPGEALAGFLGEGADGEAYWAQVAENLRLGRLRLLFVADEVPPELRRVVEFLNAKMADVEVLAVELRQYAKGEVRTLVPRVYGHSNEAEVAKPPRTRQWDEGSLLADLERRGGTEARETAERILAWAREKAPDAWWGRGANDGSVYPGLNIDGVRRILFSLWTYGRIEVQFMYLRSHRPFDRPEKLEELRQRLNAIPGVAIPEDGVARRPSFPLQALADPESLKAFFGVWEWVIEEMRAG